MALPGTNFSGFHGGICALLDELDIPRRLSDLGVGSDLAADLALKASRDPAALTNPRKASVEEIEALIREAIIGAR